MDFREATDRLHALSVSHLLQAQALGADYQKFRQWRMAPGPSETGKRGGARQPAPPEKWKPALAALARERAGTLTEYAAQVSKG